MERGIRRKPESFEKGLTNGMPDHNIISTLCQTNRSIGGQKVSGKSKGMKAGAAEQIGRFKSLAYKWKLKGLPQRSRYQFSSGANQSTHWTMQNSSSKQKN